MPFSFLILRRREPTAQVDSLMATIVRPTVASNSPWLSDITLLQGSALFAGCIRPTVPTLSLGFQMLPSFKDFLRLALMFCNFSVLS